MEADVAAIDGHELVTAHGSGTAATHLRPLEVEGEERQYGHPELIPFGGHVQTNEGRSPRELNAFKPHRYRPLLALRPARQFSSESLASAPSSSLQNGMANKAPVEVVAFDIDGVLVEPKFATVLPNLLNRPASEIAEFFGGPFKQCLLGQADLLAELPVVLRHWEWQGSVEQFVEFWFGVESNVNQAMLAFADALRANGIRCILASTQERHRARCLEALLGVGTRFERAFFSCDVGFQKPSPEFFTAVANTMNLPLDRFGLIDDVAANVESAQSLGWRGAVFRIGGDVESVAEALGVPFAT